MGVSSSKWGPCLITGGDNISNTRMTHSIHGRLVLLHALFGGFFGFLARQRPETGDLSEPTSHTSQAIQKSSQIMFTCLLSGFHGNWKTYQNWSTNLGAHRFASFRKRFFFELLSPLGRRPFVCRLGFSRIFGVFGIHFSSPIGSMVLVYEC